MILNTTRVIEVVSMTTGGYYIHDRTDGCRYWNGLIARGEIRGATREERRDAYRAAEKLRKLKEQAFIVRGQTMEYWVIPDTCGGTELTEEMAVKIATWHYKKCYTVWDLSE